MRSSCSGSRRMASPALHAIHGEPTTLAPEELEDEEEDYDQGELSEEGEEEEGEEGEEEEEEDMSRSVCQITCYHRIPDFTRPWERGSDVESCSSAFVVDVGRQLLMTTAGAVEYADKVGALTK